MRLLREYFLYRLLSGSRYRRGYRRRPRSRTNVSVGGCCLPIPLGVLAIAAAAGAVVTRR